jgi:hypothetical protein
MSTSADCGGSDRKRRAQLVLVAAAVIAVGLAPVALAYVQVGGHPNAGSGVAVADASGDVSRALERSTHDAAAGVPGNYSWSEREDAVAAVESRLDPRIETLRTSRLREGVVNEIEYNESAAQAWAAEDCPSGPDRQFGKCEADGGVVVQERAGRTHVLGVATDVTVTGDRGTVESTVRIPVIAQSAG